MLSCRWLMARTGSSFSPLRGLTLSSRSVARVFGKEHRIVLRDIRSLDCSVEFNENNFVPVAYKEETAHEEPVMVALGGEA